MRRVIVTPTVLLLRLILTPVVPGGVGTVVAPGGVFDPGAQSLPSPFAARCDRTLFGFILIFLLLCCFQIIQIL